MGGTGYDPGGGALQQEEEAGGGSIVAGTRNGAGVALCLGRFELSWASGWPQSQRCQPGLKSKFWPSSEWQVLQEDFGQKQCQKSKAGPGKMETRHCPDPLAQFFFFSGAGNDLSCTTTDRTVWTLSQKFISGYQAPSVVRMQSV